MTMLGRCDEIIRTIDNALAEEEFRGWVRKGFSSRVAALATYTAHTELEPGWLESHHNFEQFCTIGTTPTGNLKENGQ